MTTGALAAYRTTLAGSVVFNHLAPEEVDLFIRHCQVVDVGEGQVLLSEGQRGDGLYIILDGAVEFFLPERNVGGARRASRVRLNVLGPGRCFGEYGLLDDQPGSASARAVKRTRLCFLPRDDFRRITDLNDRVGKTIYLNLLRFLVGRLRAKDKELDLVLLVDEPGSP